MNEDKLPLKYRVRRIIFWGGCSVLIFSLLIGIIRGPSLLRRYVFREGVRTLSGRPVGGLGELTQDPIVILYYWATSCPHCSRAIPVLNKWHQYDDVTVVAINVGGSQAAVESYVKEHNIEYIVLLGLSKDALGSVPYTILYIMGQPVAELKGYTSGFEDWLNQSIADATGPSNESKE